MAKIQKLPREIARLIAAGEVVERPASVAKELLENAIDAGASEITLEIQNGGVRFLRITDNGCGIAREDVPNAFVRHATSKISSADDLDAICTLGFRGEALASVAAVAHVEMMTKTAEEFAGTRIVIEGGEQVSLSDAGCPNGTTLIVRDLFYNTPARMKFLKTDRAEGSAVAAVADHIALSHPEIALRFIKDGKQTLCTPGNGDVLSCIHAVYGREFAQTLIPVSYTLHGISVRGYVSKPHHARGSASMQHFFVNDRYIKTRSGAAALHEAYKNAMMVGKYPACVLFLQIPPETVDVNVHPAKTEVRFSEEKSVFDAIYYAVKNALSGDASRPQARLPQQKRAQGSLLRPTQPTAQQISIRETRDLLRVSQEPEKTAATPDKSKDFTYISNDKPTDSRKPQAREIKAYTAFLHDTKEAYAETDALDLSVRTAKAPAPADAPSVPANGETLSPPEQSAAPEFAAESTPTTPVLEVDPQEIPRRKADASQTDAPPFRLIGEAFKTYIFAECEGKLLLIDKHAAHERMLFNALKKENGSAGSQMLLAPVTVTLSKEEYAVVVAHTDVFTQAGFELEDFGEGSVRVRACPLNLETEDVTALVTEIAGYLLKNKREVLSQKLDWIYHSMACRAAIKAGDDTKDAELYAFVQKLLADAEVRYCPHGRPVLVELTRRDLDRWFGRLP